MLTGGAQHDSSSELAVFALERYRTNQLIGNALSPSLQSKAMVVVQVVYVLDAGAAHLVTGLVELLPLSFPNTDMDRLQACQVKISGYYTHVSSLIVWTTKMYDLFDLSL